MENQDWATGPPGRRAVADRGPLIRRGPWAAGPWAFGPLGRWPARASGRRAVGPRRPWAAGRWAVGLFLAKPVNALTFAKKLPKRLIFYRAYIKNEEDEYSRSEFCYPEDLETSYKTQASAKFGRP